MVRLGLNLKSIITAPIPPPEWPITNSLQKRVYWLDTSTKKIYTYYFDTWIHIHIYNSDYFQLVIDESSDLLTIMAYSEPYIADFKSKFTRYV